MKKGFTLVELLAVIVILAIIALIATPIVLNVIKQSEIGAFRTSILSASTTIDYYLLDNGLDKIPEEGINVTDLNIQSTFISGKFIIENDKTTAYFITDGKYCGYGPINYLIIEEECSSLDITPPTVNDTNFILTSTSSTVRVVLNNNVAEDLESGIKKYVLNLYQGETFIKSKELTEIGEHTFIELTKDTEYKVELVVVNNKDIETRTEKSIRTENIEVPTYEVSPEGWATSKTVSITYPSGYTNEYSIDDRTTWKPYTEAVLFTSNGTIIARVNDGTNSVTASSQTISQIDTTAPTVSSFTYETTSNSIKVTATGTDNESGIVRYQFSKDGGTTWTDVQESNEYTFSNLTAGNTYSVKVRVYNGTYVNNGESNNYLDSSAQSIVMGPTIEVAESDKTYKAIVYLDPSNLKATCNASNSVSTTRTKTGCMKWYAYAETDSTYKLILDHDTSVGVAWSSDGYNSSMANIEAALESDTSTWKSTLNARLITAGEIATITGNTDFDEDTSGWFYLDSNSQTQTATTQGASKYSWLFDYTRGCTSYGCNIEGFSFGFWTSTANDAFPDSVWVVNNEGMLNGRVAGATDLGLRPVITVSKSDL